MSGDTSPLARVTAHEYRHGMQDVSGALMRSSMDTPSGTPYLRLPWEIEVRLAEAKALLQVEPGRVATTPTESMIAVIRANNTIPSRLPFGQDTLDTLNSFSLQELSEILPGLLTPAAAAGAGIAVAPHLSNRRRPGQGFESDEQRRAFFARRGGGGGGGGGSGGGSQPPDNGDFQWSGSNWGAGSHSHSNVPTLNTSVPQSSPQRHPGQLGDGPKWWEVLRGAFSGIGGDLRAGAAITADTLTFGHIAPLNRAADSYQGSQYDVSRIAAQIGRESLLAAAGGWAFSKLRAAYDTTRVGMALNSRHLTNPLMMVGGFGGQQLLDDYRASNPIRHYHADKVLAMGSQILGYVGAMGAFGTAMKGLGAIARAIPASGKMSTQALNKITNSPFMQQMLKANPRVEVKDLLTRGGQRLSLATQTQRALKAVDRAFKAVGGTIGKVLPESWKPALSKAASGQRWLSQFTGSTLKDLPRVGKAPAELQRAARAKQIAGTMRQTAEQHRQQGQRILHDVRTVQNPTLQRLSDSHQASMLRDPGARSIYEAARQDYYRTVQLGADQSRQTAQRMFDRADNLVRRAGQLDASSQALSRQAYERLGKAALVTGGIIGTEIYDEVKIRQARDLAYEDLREGRPHLMQQDTARGPLGTAIQTMVGFNLNNPGEKQFRPGRERWHSAQGAYRAGYDAINEDYRAGHINATQRDNMLHELADRGKPWNMQGRGIWTAAPAMAAFGEWKIRDLIDRARRTHVVRVDNVYDADTATFQHPRTGELYSFPGQGPDQIVRGQNMDQSGKVRFLGFDAPELARTWGPVETHRPAEWGGPESTARMKELLQEGQFARVVQDSNARASGLGVWGRQTGYVETLPKPFDNLLRIPGLGRIIPARDVGLQITREGYGDVGVHRQLSGRTDRESLYHQAMRHAMDNELGIFSPEGRLHHPDAGQQQSPEQRADQWFEAQTGRVRPEETFWDRALTPGAIGLMTTGNTGIFRDMVHSGPGISQLYNLAVAYLGAMNYNSRAERTSPRYAYQPAVRTRGQDEADAILERMRARN